MPLAAVAESGGFANQRNEGQLKGKSDPVAGVGYLARVSLEGAGVVLADLDVVDGHVDVGGKDCGSKSEEPVAGELAGLVGEQAEPEGDFGCARHLIGQCLVGEPIGHDGFKEVRPCEVPDASPDEHGGAKVGEERGGGIFGFGS